MMRFLPLVWLAGCVEVDRVDIVVDVRERTIVLTYRDVRGDDGDLKTLVTTLFEDGTFTSPMPRATLVSQELVPRGAGLDVDVKMTFERPSDASLHAWDARFPYRFCPPADLVVTETNATAKDDQGCVLWRKGTRTLRVTAHHARPPTSGSLLPQFQAWDAQGRPPFTPPAP